MSRTTIVTGAVAGWDGLLPGWFTRLHDRHRTPVNSVVFVAAITFIFILAGVAGDLVMFAIPIAGLRTGGNRPPLLIRVAAMSGFLMTSMYALFSILPIVNVTSRTVFALKITAVIAVSNAVGAAIYRNASRAASTSWQTEDTRIEQR